MLAAAKLLAEAKRRGMHIRQFDARRLECVPHGLFNADPAFRAKLVAAKFEIMALLRYQATCVAAQILAGEFDFGTGTEKSAAADKLAPYRHEHYFRFALARLINDETTKDES